MEQWQQELKQGFRSTEALFDYLHLSDKSTDTSDFFDKYKKNPFPIRVPISYAQRIEKGNINDPLLLQVLPQIQESQSHPDFSLDAVGDLNSLKQQGVIQKYQGRVLLILTGACAIHCRYCFRKHFPYNENQFSTQQKEKFIEFIAGDPSINEVIFSGGDPLLLTDNKLFEWQSDLAKIPTIKRWRIHTRLLSALPSRVTPALLEAFQGFRSSLPHDRQVILVNHFNHPNEINEEVAAALQKIKSRGVTLLNQSVLLKNINDHPDTLKTLSDTLFNNGVLPYYLHLLDRTQGTQHFEVAEEEAVQIYKKLSSTLPGYLLPRLVREVKGMPHKVLIV